MSAGTIENLHVRTYEPRDHADVQRLYAEGLLAGHIAPNDTGADIDNIAEAYFSDERSHFWVAEAGGVVLGMIGVAEDEPDVAEVRRLRVAPSHHDTPIAFELLTTAINHCRRHGFLKVRVDTRFKKQEAALDLFIRCGFEHNRTKSVQGKDLLEFYLDLYREVE